MCLLSFCFWVVVEGHFSFLVFKTFLLDDVLVIILHFMSHLEDEVTLFSTVQGSRLLTSCWFLCKICSWFCSSFCYQEFFIAFYALFPFFPKLIFKFDCIIKCVIPSPGLLAPRCTFRPSKSLITSIIKARFNLLSAIIYILLIKIVKVSWTCWLYSGLTSGLFSFHICLFGMWLLGDFNLVHSLKSPTKSLCWGHILHHTTLMFPVCFKLACLVRI